jgi:hypothetical protein
VSALLWAPRRARSVAIPSVGSAGSEGRTARIDSVVSHHLDGFRSGVARFNVLLAERLHVPLVPLFDDGFTKLRWPLLSFKPSELSAAEAAALADAIERAEWEGSEFFLHEFCGDELERRLLAGARRIHCGNLEIHERVQRTFPGVAADVLWTPGLILDERPFRPAEISVFSFGMAHKIRVDMFRRLRDLLDTSGRSYAVYVSTANHETASMLDAEVVYSEMHEIFPDRLYFMGNLSDVAVYNNLQQTTFFAAFFERGLRANNTSVSSAMEHGAVVITNLDRYSPPEFRHMDNLIDISECDRLPSDPLLLKRLSVRAMETGRQRSWDRLVDRLSHEPD